MDLLWHLEIKIYQKRHSLALEKNQKYFKEPVVAA